MRSQVQQANEPHNIFKELTIDYDDDANASETEKIMLKLKKAFTSLRKMLRKGTRKKSRKKRR